MKWWIILVCFLFPCSHPATAADNPVITKDLALKAIAAFRAEPTSSLGKAAASVIVKFSRDSPDVLITFTPRNYPISEIKPASEQEKMALMAAFIVGNVDSQLRNESRKDGGYAGDLQLIRTYRQLQKRNPKLRIRAIEKMAELERRGELKRYLSSK
jgi:hypothetical protein